MTDRFKFRVFDSRENKYLDIPTYIMQDGNLVDKTLEKGWFDGGYILEMSTGLKDKNGNLIYEGDIVKYIYYDSVSRPYRIVWKNYSFMLKPIDETDNCDYERYLYDYSYTNKLEIIGNIHENKDLENNNDF